MLSQQINHKKEKSQSKIEKLASKGKSVIDEIDDFLEYSQETNEVLT
jgi:hypothetical protein